MAAPKPTGSCTSPATQPGKQATKIIYAQQPDQPDQHSTGETEKHLEHQTHCNHHPRHHRSETTTASRTGQGTETLLHQHPRRRVHQLPPEEQEADVGDHAPAANRAGRHVRQEGRVQSRRLRTPLGRLDLQNRGMVKAIAACGTSQDASTPSCRQQHASSSSRYSQDASQHSARRNAR